LRGLLADGVRVSLGEKVGDVEPRGAAVDPARVSDKARAVAAGVLEALLLGARR
jgi:xanthine dehydrogenase accessory factor